MARQLAPRARFRLVFPRIDTRCVSNVHWQTYEQTHKAPRLGFDHAGCCRMHWLVFSYWMDSVRCPTGHFCHWVRLGVVCCNGVDRKKASHFSTETRFALIQELTASRAMINACRKPSVWSAATQLWGITTISTPMKNTCGTLIAILIITGRCSIVMI